MFNPFKKKPAAAMPQPFVLQMRETLFGDQPMEQFCPATSTTADPAPWGQLAAARDALQVGRTAKAEAIYRSLLGTPLESRVEAQVWHALRSLGHAPQDGEIKVLGAIAEAGVNGGLDIVAAYRDGTARYYNYSGAAVIWESPGTDAGIDSSVQRLLATAEKVASFAGVHNDVRPGPPPQGQVRLTALVTDGLHFGQAPMEFFANDPVAGPFLAEAIQLMQLLMARHARLV